MFPGVTVTLQESAHIGHGAIIHGAQIGRNSLIGMNAVIMDEVVIEEECIIGALCFVKAKSHIPRRSLVVGNPHKIIKEVSDEMIVWKTKGTKIYQGLPGQMKSGYEQVEPLTKIEDGRPEHERFYDIFKK